MGLKGGEINELAGESEIWHQNRGLGLLNNRVAGDNCSGQENGLLHNWSSNGVWRGCGAQIL